MVRRHEENHPMDAEWLEAGLLKHEFFLGADAAANALLHL